MIIIQLIMYIKNDNYIIGFLMTTNKGNNAIHIVRKIENYFIEDIVVDNDYI